MSGWTISPAAAKDLESIVDYIGIEQQKPEAAQRLIDEFVQAFDMLASAPEVGRSKTGADQRGHPLVAPAPVPDRLRTE